MEIKTCKKCKKFFNSLGREIYCPRCNDELEKEFQNVKKYLEENPNSNIVTIANECKVKENQIKEWIRQERLEIKGGVGITCEKCGRMIPSGRYCDDCKAKLTGLLQKTAQELKPTNTVTIAKTSTGSKMRFLDKK